jgi:hypothetical protein
MRILLIQIAQSMGYVLVGLHVDPDDLPSHDTITGRVFDQICNPNPDPSSRFPAVTDPRPSPLAVRRLGRSRNLAMRTLAT